MCELEHGEPHYNLLCALFLGILILEMRQLQVKRSSVTVVITSITP
jgi:hypothetical protein